MIGEGSAIVGEGSSTTANGAGSRINGVDSAGQPVEGVRMSAEGCAGTRTGSAWACAIILWRAGKPADQPAHKNRRAGAGCTDVFTEIKHVGVGLWTRRAGRGGVTGMSLR